MSFKGFFLFAFSLAIFNIGLAINNVDKDVIMIFSMLISILLGPYFISGKIFEDEEQIDE